jgi:hypothetical protein
MNAMEVVLPSEAVAALENGRIIDAIKIVRERSGLGLKESKDAVDHYLDTHPELSERCRAAGAQGGPVVVVVLALLLFVGLALFLWLQKR